MATLQGPAWDNSSEYAGFDSAEFTADFASLLRLTTEIQERLRKIQGAMNAELAAISPTPALQRDELVQELQAISVLRHEAVIVGLNLMSYANLESSVDAKFERARQESVRTQDAMAALNAATLPLNLFLKRCSPELLKSYLQHPTTQSEDFSIQQGRAAEVFSLSEAEEVTLAQFANHGPAAWGRLYTQISSSIQVETAMGRMGLSQANAYLRSADENERREAWQGAQKAWKPFEDSIAAVLNSLAGWRHEEYRKRSARRPMDFLTSPLLGSRIERETLDAMVNAIQSRRDLTQRALRLMAKSMGKSKVDPWDLLAPAPKTGDATKAYAFSEAIALIRRTFVSINPEMGQFLDGMVENKCIEGRVLPNKRTGAFCSGFKKSRTQRVFQTYMGSLQDVSTLAHELGHAFHSWIMRDIPYFETLYPMTLAETASIFAETALADEMARTGNAELVAEVAWADVSDAVSFLANIPARFEFEKAFYERRQQTTLSPAELSDLTATAWKNWYGDELSQPESQFWMTKLHFSIANVSFYNFPYSFGYLFSLAVYAYRDEWGDQFYPKYCALLRDTGRMTAEDLAMKHLGQDLRQPEFWLKSLAIVEKKISRFEELSTGHGLAADVKSRPRAEAYVGDLPV